MLHTLNPKWAEIASLKDPQLSWLRAEAHVLSSLLSNWSDHSATLGWNGLQYQLEPEHFATPEGQFFYETMVSMRDRSIPCDDPTSFFEEVRNSCRAKPSEIMQACLPIIETTTTNVNYWARLVLDGYLHRQLESALSEMTENRTQETRARVMKLEDAIAKLKESEGFGDRKFVLIHHAIEDFIELLEQRIADSDKGIEAIETGWGPLDVKLKFGKGHFIVLGGRSGMGKTSFAFNLINRFASTGWKVGFFSMEHDRSSVIQNLISIEASVSYEKMDRGDGLTSDELDRIAEASRRFQSWNLAISDKTGATIGDIKSEMEAMRRSMGGLDVVFIDHMHATGDDKAFKGVREKYIYVSGQLKAMASAFQVPIIAVAQMNRDADKRQDKRPQVSDLKESSSIEQDADTILFVYRDSFYAGAGYEVEKKGMSIAGAVEVASRGRNMNNPFTEIICRKNRHGSAQNFTLLFEYNPRTKQFFEATNPDKEP